MTDEGADVTIDLDASIRLPEHVVYRSFASEVVLLNLQTGQYHGVNPTGGRMLEAIERAGSVRESADEIAREFGQPVERVQRDLVTFCLDLAQRGLVVVDADGH